MVCGKFTDGSKNQKHQTRKWIRGTSLSWYHTIRTHHTPVRTIESLPMIQTCRQVARLQPSHAARNKPQSSGDATNSIIRKLVISSWYRPMWSHNANIVSFGILAIAWRYQRDNDPVTLTFIPVKISLSPLRRWSASFWPEAGINGCRSKCWLPLPSKSLLLLRDLVNLWCCFYHAHKHHHSGATIEMPAHKLLPEAGIIRCRSKCSLPLPSRMQLYSTILTLYCATVF